MTICSRCKKQSDREGGQCSKCLEYSRKYCKEHIYEYRQWNKDSTKRWASRNPEVARNNMRKVRENARRKALEIIGKGKIICSHCGCDDYRILEINHKNLGGTKEYEKILKSPQKILWDIIHGRRKTDDLEILCRVCNALHYVEKRFNIRGFNITWKK